METEKLYSAIFKTLSYADIFSFPLTKNNIWKFLIWEEDQSQIKKKELEQFLAQINKYSNDKIRTIQELYFFSGREKIISLFKKRQLFAKQKKQIARKTARILKKIPNIKLIGLSGSLALNNTDKDDDIDLFIITKKNTLWITRFIASILLEIKKIRRHPKQIDIKDKICLNMFIDENNLSLPKNERNLYTAHEVIQMLPLWDKDNTYNKFLNANKWVIGFLPNALLNAKGSCSPGNKLQKNFSDFGLQILEFIQFFFQRLYMRRLKNEVITRGYVRFHPEDKSQNIIKIYRQKIKSLI